MRKSVVGWRASLLLLLLATGVAGSSLDLVGHHVAPVRAATAHLDESTAAPAHLVRDEAASDAPPCNACFFHKLLTSAVVASRAVVTPAEGARAVAVPRFADVPCSCLGAVPGRAPPSA